MKEKRKTPSRRAQLRRRGLVEYPSTLHFAVAIFFCCAAFEVYGSALHGPFVYDDFSLPFYKPGFPTQVFTAWIAGVRPLLMFSYWMNFQWSGQNPLSYHVLNLALHLVNAALVFLIARRILTWTQIGQQQAEILSAFGSALFLLHPIQTESVAYIAGRSELLSAFFFLAAFCVFVYRPTPAIGWPRSLLLLILFVCAVATKENTITLPILFLLTDVFWAPEGRIAAVRRNWRLYVLMLGGGLLSAGVVGYQVNHSSSAGFHGAGVSWVTYFLTECRVFFVYLRLLLAPVNQNFDHDIPWAASTLDLATFISLLGILALTVVAWRLRERFRAGCYGFLVFLLLLAPTSSFIPIKDAIAERRLYLPMLGFVLVACECLLFLSRERKWVLGVAGGLIVAAAIATEQRGLVWASETALWEDTVTKSPNKVGDYGHLVHGLVREHRCHEALNRLREISARLKPDAALLSHWSFAYECVGEPEHALEKLEQSAALLPWPSTYLNMARHQLTLNRLEDATQSIGRALNLNPRLEPAYLMRAGIFEDRGDLLAAARDYQYALHLNPADQEASFRLRRISAMRQQFRDLSSP